MRTSIFGLPITYDKWRHQNTLPLYIAGNYGFQTMYIDNIRCIMLTPKDDLASLPSLKKQIAKIQDIDPVPVVLKLASLSTYRRKSLLENRIPFVTEKQAYLPFIGTLLTDAEETVAKIDKFVFSTQQLFLLYLYEHKKKLYLSEATKKLPFSAMTISRAVKQLEISGLFEISKNGVNKVIESKYGRLELFEKAKPYLSSPVRRKGYIDRSQITTDMVPSGETALARKTMLNEGRVAVYATEENHVWKDIMCEEFIDPSEQVMLELWAYSPTRFSDGEMADDISVVLSFAGNTDERIEEAIEELTERELREQ